MSDQYKINSFPLTKGKINLGVSTKNLGAGRYLCATDGLLTITWDDDTSDTVTCLAGDPFDVVDATNLKSVVIASGTFHKGT